MELKELTLTFAPLGIDGDKRLGQLGPPKVRHVTMDVRVSFSESSRDGLIRELLDGQEQLSEQIAERCLEAVMEWGGDDVAAAMKDAGGSLDEWSRVFKNMRDALKGKETKD